MCSVLKLETWFSMYSCAKIAHLFFLCAMKVWDLTAVSPGQSATRGTGGAEGHEPQRYMAAPLFLILPKLSKKRKTKAKASSRDMSMKEDSESLEETRAPHDLDIDASMSSGSSQAAVV